MSQPAPIQEIPPSTGARADRGAAALIARYIQELVQARQPWPERRART